MVAAADANPEQTAGGMRQPGGRATIFKAGSMVERETDAAVTLMTHGNGLPAAQSPSDLSLEMAMFAVLFVHGRGAFTAESFRGSFAEYLRYRMNCSFSPFTLHKPYLMLCYLIRQCDMLQRSCGERALEKDMHTYRSEYEEGTWLIHQREE